MKMRRPSAYQVVVGSDVNIVIPAAKLSSTLNTILHANGGMVAVDVVANNQFWRTYQRVSSLHQSNQSLVDAGFEYRSKQHQHIAKLVERLYNTLNAVTKRSTRCDYMIIVNNCTRRSIVNKVMKYYKQSKQDNNEAKRNTIMEVDTKSEPSLFNKIFPSIESYVPIQEKTDGGGNKRQNNCGNSQDSTSGEGSLEYTALVLDDNGIKKLSFFLSQCLSEDVRITPVYKKYRVWQFIYEQIASIRPVLTPLRIMSFIVAVIMLATGNMGFAVMDLAFFLMFTGFYIASLDYAFAGMSIYGTLQDEVSQIQDYSTYYHRQKIIESGIFIVTSVALFVVLGLTIAAMSGDLTTLFGTTG